MRLLLDTHAFLWFITADAQLSSAAERAIGTPGNDAFLSIASVWEMAIKLNLGKLPIPLPLETFIPEQLRVNRIRLLPMELPHTKSLDFVCTTRKASRRGRRAKRRGRRELN